MLEESNRMQYQMSIEHNNESNRLFLRFLTVEDVSESIPDGPHKCFMRRYLKDWPCPHLIHYTAGQTLNVELNGVQQKCEVQVVDSSLIQVVFQVSIKQCYCVDY